MAPPPSDQQASAGPGRPRRYNEVEELERLLDAGFEVIRREGYRSATVADILTEADLSTRSFYRHFAGKDDLFHSLFRREAEQFAARVAARVGDEPDPAAALIVWIDEILGFGFDRRRAGRAAVLGAPAALSSLEPAELNNALAMSTAPLVEILAAGVADGSFTTCDPAADAPLISGLAWDGSTRLKDVRELASKRAVRAALIAFVKRALGAAQ